MVDYRSSAQETSVMKELTINQHICCSTAHNQPAPNVQVSQMMDELNA